MTKSFNSPSWLYSQSLALHTDLYQLTMAYAYWKKGLAERPAVFYHFFRRRPFGGALAVAAGLETAITYVQKLRFDASDIEYLAGLATPTGKPIFEKKFLDFLLGLKIACDVDAVPEGTPVFPQEPLLRVQGPLLHAQLLESPFLNIINFQTLIATKAARIAFAAKGDPVIEFGLRRAHGFDGAFSASRAAFIGGCEGTSNVLAGKLLGIPVRGTHAHSWVMAFDEEVDSFDAFAEALPENCIFLVDTYDTLEGVRKAIAAGKRLRERGVEMAGVRLDSGDLAYLSIEIRRMLDEAGFTNAKIMASNELDEYLINDLKHQGARIAIWAVGTHLVTGKDQPAFDGVYKLAALADEKGIWHDKMKLSEQMAKMTNPGPIQVRRFYDEKGYIADMMYKATSPCQPPYHIIDQFDPARERRLGPDVRYNDLLKPVLRGGELVAPLPGVKEIQSYSQEQLKMFHPTIRRFFNPQTYLVGLEKSLYAHKIQMIQTLRSNLLG